MNLKQEINVAKFKYLRQFPFKNLKFKIYKTVLDFSIGFQEKNSNLDRNSKLGPPDL